jgi:hypothetical protein
MRHEKVGKFTKWRGKGEASESFDQGKPRTQKAAGNFTDGNTSRQTNNVVMLGGIRRVEFALENV